MIQINDDCQIKGLAEIYERHLPQIGTFVEVGAYDGITHSNTLGLLKAGWRGIYIEPVEAHYDSLIQNLVDYRRAEFVNCAASNFYGQQVMSIRGELSSLNKDFDPIIDTMSFAPPIQAIEVVDVLTLDDILVARNIKSRFDLLVIDTEGSEHLVLAGFNLYRFMPRMIIVEMHEESTDWTQFEDVKKANKEIYEKLSPMYEAIYKDDINTIFVID